MMAVQESPTSIRVTWTPSTCANGYIIFYSTGSSSDRVNASDDSTDNYLLKGLLNGATYNMSIVATSQHFFSNNAIVGIVHLGKNISFKTVTAGNSLSIRAKIMCGIKALTLQFQASQVSLWIM